MTINLINELNLNPNKLLNISIEHQLRALANKYVDYYIANSDLVGHDMYCELAYNRLVNLVNENKVNLKILLNSFPYMYMTPEEARLLVTARQDPMRREEVTTYILLFYAPIITKAIKNMNIRDIHQDYQDAFNLLFIKLLEIFDDDDLTKHMGGVCISYISRVFTAKLVDYIGSTELISVNKNIASMLAILRKYNTEELFKLSPDQIKKTLIEDGHLSFANFSTDKINNLIRCYLINSQYFKNSKDINDLSEYYEIEDNLDYNELILNNFFYEEIIDELAIEYQLDVNIVKYIIAEAIIHLNAKKTFGKKNNFFEKISTNTKIETKKIKSIIKDFAKSLRSERS